MNTDKSLRIVHCVRSPVGGIFRHLGDLAVAQSAAGHQVGIICDSLTGGAFEDAHIERLRPHLALGVTRFPMRRAISPADLVALYKVYRQIAAMKPDVLHAHGSKGGAYARVIGSLMRLTGHKVARFYCPHGGVLHYDPASREGKVYFMLERLLERMSDGLIFVSDYERRNYTAKIGVPHVPTTLTYNGVGEDEWAPVVPNADARDFVFAGMMRDLKGPDVFIEALAMLRDLGLEVSANMFGDGPDRGRYEARVDALGLGDRVAFFDPAPIRQVMATARTMVVPSRAESMPYIVIETIAADMPLIATNVGGIPEIFGEASDRLVEAGNAEALAGAMAEALAHPAAAIAAAGELRCRARRIFHLDAMAATVETAYRAALDPAPAGDRHAPPAAGLSGAPAE
ncbi:MAG: glycosyltransferase [Hyphomicrobiaceae bacterium]|nr:glycosyltransferase [Hyphomicrobiaceae bacterium]